MVSKYKGISISDNKLLPREIANEESNRKLTPLKIAMEDRNLELFAYLVDNDADINKIGYDGYNSLIYAIILDDKKTEQAEYNAELYDDDEAQILRQETIGNIFAKYLIEKGADVSIPSTRGCVVEKIKVRKFRSPYRNRNSIDSDDDEYEVIRSEEWTPLYYAITLGDRNSLNPWNPDISIAIINKPEFNINILIKMAEHIFIGY